jgi:Secretion system C-terminal sorting domain
MKRIINILVLLQLCIIAVAQPPYPAAPPAPGTITRVEYFIRPFGGADPGFGNGSVLAITPQQNINGYTEAINLSALPQGFYNFYIRTLDADGKWSLTNSNKPFSYIIAPVYPSAAAAPSNIVRLEYVIDVNLPFGAGTPITITPGVNIANLNAVIDLTGLNIGPHILYIRSLDADGKWSLTNIRFFSNAATPNYPSAPAAAGNISRMEYFIDTDPGFGLGTSIPFTAGTDVTVTNFSISTVGLPAGNHVLYIRSNTNPWGLVTARTFSVNSTLPVTWLYVQGQMKQDGALIQWATASESNTDRFEIEHSTDAVNYKKAGTVTAAGNSSNTINYEWLHAAAASGVNYYRIKQIDLDGKFSYSAIIKLLRSNTSRIILTPNPATNQAIILFNKPSAKTNLRLFSSSGALVTQQQINEGSLQHTIDVSKLLAGVYLLQLQTADGIETFKLVKH